MDGRARGSNSSLSSSRRYAAFRPARVFSGSSIRKERQPLNALQRTTPLPIASARCRGKYNAVSSGLRAPTSHARIPPGSSSPPLERGLPGEHG